jgi:hypothetical protein
MEAANDGGQDCGGVVATVVEQRRNRGSEMWPCEQVKVVEEGSWMLYGTKKNSGKLEQLLARRGGVGGSQQRSGERRAGELEGQVVRLKRRGVAGSAGARRRGAAGGGAEQQRKQRGRGERRMMRTSP